MATARVNDVELYYDDIGSGECIVLTHGSWTDATGWQDAAALLAHRYRVVTWDRRGHSRSQPGDTAGSRAEDAADLAALIEHVSSEPVRLVGNSYGANVTLTLVATRPDLVASAAAHEPPLFGLLGGTRDPTLQQELTALAAELVIVRDLILAGRHHDAAERFVEYVALGPGAWEQLPAALRATLERNARTYLDEMADETAPTIDAAVIASTQVPVLLSHGTQSPALFPAVIAKLGQLIPAHIEVLEGAGHVPHTTHTRQWVAQLVAFHEHCPSECSVTRPAIRTDITHTSSRVRSRSTCATSSRWRAS